jgi:hypothetical protein
MRTATYIYEQLKLLPHSNAPFLADIFVGHRTGVAGFFDVKQGRKHLKYDFANPEGKLDLMFTDTKGNILNQKDPDFFEFSLENYEGQLADLQTMVKEVNNEKSLITNQNIINQYFLQLKEELFGENAHNDHKRTEKIEQLLNGENHLIGEQILSYLTTTLIEGTDSQQDELTTLLINYFNNHPQTYKNLYIYIKESLPEPMNKEKNLTFESSFSIF